MVIMYDLFQLRSLPLGQTEPWGGTFTLIRYFICNQRAVICLLGLSFSILSDLM